MRKVFWVFAAVACCACSKGVVEPSVVQEEMVELKFSVPVTASKASGLMVEDAVENLQVFVFGKNGENYIRISLCSKPEVLEEAAKRIKNVM